MPRIFQALDAGKKSSIEAKQVSKQANIRLQSEQKKIVNMQAAFKKDEAILSDAKRKARIKAIAKRIQAYEKMTAELQRNIDEKRRAFAEKMLKPVQKIVLQLAKEEGLNVVFERTQSGLLYVDDALDMTDEVIRRLKAREKK